VLPSLNQVATPQLTQGQVSKQNRASGFRLVLTIFTMIQEVLAGSGRKKKAATSSSTTPTLQASPQALNRLLDDKGHINPVLKLKIKDIFDRYEGLIKHSSSQVTATRWKVNANSVFDPAPEFLRNAGITHVRTFSPLELVVTAILVAVHKDHRTDEQLLEDVREMRKYLRINHKDLRVNAQCWITAWKFITTEMNTRRGLDHATGPDPVHSLRQSIEGGLKKPAGASRNVGATSESSSARFGSSSPLSSAPSSSPDRGDKISPSLESSLIRGTLAEKKAISNARLSVRRSTASSNAKVTRRRGRDSVKKSRPPKRKLKANASE